MMQQLINDVNKALDAECYYAALSLVLTFPDICGKAEYPQEKSTAKRYKDWYDEYIGKYERCPCDYCKNTPMPYLSGEVVYSLRNFLLHQGTPNIDPLRIKNYNNKIDNFELVIESKKPFDFYSDASGIIDGKVRTYRINVRRFCLIVCSNARMYYESNQDKFNFFNFSIINWDIEIEKNNLR
ncbi:hypothetical protein C8E03_101333 [Lachnotalea glycerini]|uniref:Uncharacterized protein n=1 Tax=Lachnotalea glycerini TaxID=1763509 RepID=A0A318EW41_9FIRM|nr:hypothetical protein [Lachnotalea glycerini]PXV95703.1 hypothetical protein C8E03_101333 [Lachnotalea glycerini]